MLVPPATVTLNVAFSSSSARASSSVATVTVCAAVESAGDVTVPDGTAV